MIHAPNTGADVAALDLESFDSLKNSQEYLLDLLWQWLISQTHTMEIQSTWTTRKAAYPLQENFDDCATITFTILSGTYAHQVGKQLCTCYGQGGAPLLRRQLVRLAVKYGNQHRMGSAWMTFKGLDEDWGGAAVAVAAVAVAAAAGCSMVCLELIDFQDQSEFKFQVTGHI